MTNQNPVLDTIKNRRSIRKYTDKPIEQAVLNDIIEAGFCAPSAMNRRPYHFMIVTDRETLDKIPTVQPYTKMVTHSNCVIFVCGDYDVSGDFYIDDCAAATQNILLAATSLGVGSCWCGVQHTGRQEKFSEILNLPTNIRPYSLIVLGYPDEEKEGNDRYDESHVHVNKW